MEQKHAHVSTREGTGRKDSHFGGTQRFAKTRVTPKMPTAKMASQASTTSADQRCRKRT
jgi:hypothetical protein